MSGMVGQDSANARVTLKIEGPYFPFRKFRAALDSFASILSELDKETSENGKATIDWSVNNLERGSIVFTAEASIISENVPQERPHEVVDLLHSGLGIIQSEPAYPDGFSGRALKCIRDFGNLIDPNDFAAITLGSREWTAPLTKQLISNVDEVIATDYASWGSIEGDLVSITLAKASAFGVRISSQKRVVKCFFEEEQFESARSALGERVYVFGQMRQYLHGDKINIKVQEMRRLPSLRDSKTPSEILSLLGG